MQTYIRLFLNLLMPLIVLISIISIGYFTFDYSFSKAFKLGILAGVLLGIGISLIMAMLLLLLRRVQPQNTREIEYIEEETETVNTASKQRTAEKEPIAVSKEIKCMLLMDKELTFDILLNALKKNKEYVLSSSDPRKGTLSIETKEGIIQTTITSLTKHTSQIILYAQDNVKPVRHLITELKEKETSFLQY